MAWVLNYEIRQGNLETLENLLSTGINPNIMSDQWTRDGWFTPSLMVAYDYGGSNGNIDAFNILLAYGADPNNDDGGGLPIFQSIIKHFLQDLSDGKPVSNMFEFIKSSLLNGARMDIGNPTARDLIIDFPTQYSYSAASGRPNRTSDKEAVIELNNLLDEFWQEEENKNRIDSPPSEPDMDQMREEAARDIQRRIRGNRQRRKLTKTRQRYGRMAKPTTEREKMRRWTDLTKMYDDDPIKGYEQFSIYPEWLLPHRTREQQYTDHGYKNGYDLDGYDPDGYDLDGYDPDGYDIDGYDGDGYDKDGYDGDGYDANGYDVEGLDINGERLDQMMGGYRRRRKTFRRRYRL